MRAKIDRETRTVQFIEESDMLSLVDSIEAKNRRIVELMKFIAEKEKSMRTDQTFLYEVTKKAASSGGADRMDVDDQSAGYGYVN